MNSKPVLVKTFYRSAPLHFSISQAWNHPVNKTPRYNHIPSFVQFLHEFRIFLNLEDETFFHNPVHSTTPACSEANVPTHSSLYHIIKYKRPDDGILKPNITQIQETQLHNTEIMPLWGSFGNSHFCLSICTSVCQHALLHYVWHFVLSCVLLSQVHYSSIP